MPEVRWFTHKDQPYKGTYTEIDGRHTLLWKMMLPDGNYYGDGAELPEPPDEKMWEILTVSAHNFIDDRLDDPPKKG